MWKVFLAGVVGIAILVGGSVAVLLTLTGDGPSRSRSPVPTPEATEASPAPQGSAAPVQGDVTFGSQAPPPPPEAVPVAPVAPPPPPNSWEAVPLTARAKSLGRMGGLIQARLNDLADDLRTCFTADAQAKHGGSAITMVKDAAPMDDAGTLVLVLQLEGQPGSIRIVDAPVETRGPAGDELISCAQNFLRGRVLEVPSAVPGAKHRLLFPLMP